MIRCLAAPLLAVLGACAPMEGPSPHAPAPEQPPREAPDLVLLLISDLRADLEGAALAEAALLAPFEDDITLRATAAYAQSVSTFTSAGSALTGRYPSAIPLCGLGAPAAATQELDAWCHHLPEGIPTLPGVLGLYGYRSALHHPDIPAMAHLAAGFDTTAVLPTEQDRRDASRSTAWDRLAGDLERWWQQEAVHPRLLVLLLDDLEICGRGADMVRMGIERPSEQLCGGFDPARVEQHYRTSASNLGESLRALLQALPPAAGRERWVALAGTRGVSLGECSGTANHPRFFCWSDVLLERTAHVPLVFMGPPGRARREIHTPTELVDLLPSLLGRAGAVPPAGLPGEDLLAPGWTAGGDPYAYAEFGDMLMVRWDRHLVTFRAPRHNGSSIDPWLTSALERANPEVHFSLYDVVDDPFQTHNLGETRPRIRQEGLQRLRALRAGPGALPPGLTEREVSQRIRLTPAQGYW
ncbi:MAG: hypothetical protein ABIO70_06885 [Pseudomonadota bacterium]